MYRSPPVALLAILLLCLSLNACTSPDATTVPVEPTAESLVKLDVGTSATTTRAAIDGALQMGFFTKNGLDVNLVSVPAGPDAVAALIAGDIDVCETGGAAIVNSALAGSDLVFVAGMINQQFYSLVVRPEIKTAHDLKGKVVAVSRAGSSSDTVTRHMLEALDLEPDAEVSILAVGRSTERLAAMETGQVAGAAVLVTEVPRAREMGLEVLVSASDLDMPFPHTGIAVTRTFLEDNRQTVAHFVQAITESLARMKSDRASTVEIMAENMLLDPEQDSAYLNEVYDLLVVGYFPQKPYPTREGIQALIDAGLEENPGAVKLTADDIIDASFVQELDDSGFIDELYDQ